MMAKQNETSKIVKGIERSGQCLGCGRGVTVIHYTLDGAEKVFRGGCGCSDGEKEQQELKRVLYSL